MMHDLCVTADLPVKANGHSLCVNCTDVCRLLGLKQGDVVRVTFELVPPSVLIANEIGITDLTWNEPTKHIHE